MQREACDRRSDYANFLGKLLEMSAGLELPVVSGQRRKGVWRDTLRLRDSGATPVLFQLQFYIQTSEIGSDKAHLW